MDRRKFRLEISPIQLPFWATSSSRAQNFMTLGLICHGNTECRNQEVNKTNQDEVTERRDAVRRHLENLLGSSVTQS